MKKVCCFLALSWTLLSSAEAQEPSAWEKSIVVVDVSRKHYEYLQPWTTRMRNSQKTGLVLERQEILTTADEMFDRTLIRVQRGGRGKWWAGELKWIDYHSNLALVRVPDEAFWNGLEPVKLADPTRADGPMQIVRWRQGRLESRRAEFNQFTVGEGQLCYAPQLQLEVNSEIQGAGSGEPLVSNSDVIGLIAGQQGNNCTVVPSAFVVSVLSAVREQRYQGLGYFHFVWQPAENPASLSYLKLDGEPRGVLVISVPPIPGIEPVLKPRDVLMQVDGHDIDIQGDYLDPEYGHLSLENLATWRKWAGEKVKLKIWRDGKEHDLTYQLPRADARSQLVPEGIFDQNPEYLIVGGFVFQPLTENLLKSWGPEWKRRSPFRLFYYTMDFPDKEQPSLVVLSQVLPDSYSLGYHDLKFLVLESVNGQKISRLEDIREALKKPDDGVHTLLFVRSDSLRRVVIGADDQERATRRVLARYGITKDHFIVPDKAASEASVAALP